MIISVDSYQYFGGNEAMLPKLLSFVKKGGLMAPAVPGFTQDFPEGQLPKAGSALLDAGVVFLFLRLVAGITGKRIRHNDHYVA